MLAVRSVGLSRIVSGYLRKGMLVKQFLYFAFPFGRRAPVGLMEKECAVKSNYSRIPLLSSRTPAGRKKIAEMGPCVSGTDERLVRTVADILELVRHQGDTALISCTRRFDKVKTSAAAMRLDPQFIVERGREAPAPLKRAIREAARRITAYHRLQRSEERVLRTAEATLSYRSIALQRVGVYIPGGHTVYPSSVLMNVIPARIAGVEQIAAVTPPGRDLHPGVAFALSILGVEEVYRIGGAQAIAALAYGTESIAAVDKIVGPGNAYVAVAKRLVYGTVDIDTIAGPSEVVILADDSVRPLWVALDLLAQAEHGSGNERAVCITEDERFARSIQESALKEFESSPVRAILDKLSTDAIVIAVTRSRTESIELVNRIAPEHLQIMTRRPRRDLVGIRNAAAVFLGPHTPVALGDYFIGTNHVLPTGGAARYSSPLGVDSFVKRVSIAEATAAGLKRAAPFVSVLARSESFIHHALSVERRVADSR